MEGDKIPATHSRAKMDIQYNEPSNEIEKRKQKRQARRENRRYLKEELKKEDITPIPSACPFCSIVPVVFGSGSGFFWIEHQWVPKCPMCHDKMPLSQWEKRGDYGTKKG